MNITFIISGASCPPGQPLGLENTEEHICEKLRGTHWSRITCVRFKTDLSWQFKNCSNWCDIFARCFNENETAYWSRQCSAMFRQSSPSRIVATSDDASSPVMETFRVYPCSPFWSNEYAVRLPRCNCSVDETGRGK